MYIRRRPLKTYELVSVVRTEPLFAVGDVDFLSLVSAVIGTGRAHIKAWTQ